MFLRIRKYLPTVLTVLQAFLATLAVFCDKTVVVSELADFEPFLLPCVGVLSLAVFGAFTLTLFRIRKRIRLTRGQKIIALALSFFFAVLWTVGYSLNTADTFFYWGLRGVFPKIVYFILLSGLTSAFYGVLQGVFSFFCTTDGMDLSPKEPHIKRSFFKSYLACVGVWGIYYALFFPGVVTSDSYYQTNQALGFQPLTNEHPFLHTLLEACIMKPVYALTGQVEAGIAVFTAFQVLVLGLIVAFAYVTLIRLQVKKTVRYCFLLFYVAVPLVGAYAVTLWKDIWMASLLLLFGVLLVRYLYLGRRSWRNLVALGLSSFGVLAAKGTGIIMIVFALTGLIFALKKHWYKVLIPITLSILCFYGLQILAVNMFDVIPAHTRETKSVFIQQVSRVVKYHKDDLTDYEKETISEVLPYEQIPELYDPRISDSIKIEMNEEVYEKNPEKYIDLWLSLGEKYPETYAHSFVAGNHGYWYPDTEYWAFSRFSYRRVLDVGLYYGWDMYDPNLENYDLSQETFVPRENITMFFECVEQLPVISFFTSIGLYFWGYLVLFSASLWKKDSRIMPFLFMGAGVFFSCLMSPVFAEMRYAYPAIYLFPLVVVLCKIPKQKA